MGYTTEFDGTFKIDPPLNPPQTEILREFSQKRHDPDTRPSFYCDWTPTSDGTGLRWNGSEKFYSYDRWLKVLIDEFLTPWGCTLSGSVHYSGEKVQDHGMLTVADGVVTKRSCC